MTDAGRKRAIKISSLEKKKKSTVERSADYRYPPRSFVRSFIQIRGVSAREKRRILIRGATRNSKLKVQLPAASEREKTKYDIEPRVPRVNRATKSMKQVNGYRTQYFLFALDFTNRISFFASVFFSSRF